MLIEIWADSFHEGVWCCENIINRFSGKGFCYRNEYENGFLPTYYIENKASPLVLKVYGGYTSWEGVPSKVSDVIKWGKPDFIAYSPDDDKILFAVEETAAIPTGNQATQRCERQFGSAHLRIPYWYFISEFGKHSDGGIRRDSPWPTVAALKLTKIFRSPCMVVHYSDPQNVENYNAGKGLGFLFGALTQIIENFMCGRDNLYGMKSILTEQYQYMLDFVQSQWRKVVDFMPSLDLLQDKNTANALSDYALESVSVDTPDIDKLLEWPKISGLPPEIRKKLHAKALLKYDALAELLEKDVESKKAYSLSDNAGSGRPPTREDLKKWIEEQKKLFDSVKNLPVPAVSFTMKESDFPATSNQNCHITTSKNNVYLYDRWGDLKQSVVAAYPRLKNKLDYLNEDTPVFLYLSNSIKPGRIFGDPYTGQLSAFSTAFGKFDKDKRLVIAYFPHQTYIQAVNAKKNKGLVLMKELTDLIIFNGGVAVNLNTGKIF